MKIDLRKAGIIAGGVAGMITSFRVGLLIKDAEYEKISEQNDKLRKANDELFKLIELKNGRDTPKELDEMDKVIKNLKQIYNI